MSSQKPESSSEIYSRIGNHDWAKKQFAQTAPPLYTCESVLSEAFHLLEPVPTGPERLVSILERDIFDTTFSYVDNRSRIHDLLRTYVDQPMSFADACLVRMAEVRPECALVTTDADFRIYRTASDEPIHAALPDG